MQGGDISNEVSARMVIVFEGLLGFPPAPGDASFTAGEKRSKWGRKKPREMTTAQIVDEWTLNEALCVSIWDTVWRFKYSVDVVTYLGDEFAHALEARFDREQLPIGRVWATQPNLLTRQLAYAPHIAGVFHAQPEHRMTYGSKGYYVDPSSPNLMGAL